MKPVGIYREMYRKARSDLPPLRDSYTDEPIDDRSRVVGYMNSCTPVFDVLADVTDLIDERRTIRSGASLFSDGEWIWRADSVHYLENYPLGIPLAFLEHVRSRNYQPPTDIDVSDPSFDDAISSYF